MPIAPGVSLLVRGALAGAASALLPRSHCRAARPHHALVLELLLAAVVAAVVVALVAAAGAEVLGQGGGMRRKEAGLAVCGKQFVQGKAHNHSGMI